MTTKPRLEKPEDILDNWPEGKPITFRRYMLAQRGVRNAVIIYILVVLFCWSVYIWGAPEEVKRSYGSYDELYYPELDHDPYYYDPWP